ncbi:MAG: PSD1 and planctomycete cytochrome C domain-containing protein [Phycisphaerales bacterium]|nr:PSD1 and planctomycete cytochrome C domain-containing protein [Phycisphaerales bacterium]
MRLLQPGPGSYSDGMRVSVPNRWMAVLASSWIVMVGPGHADPPDDAVHDGVPSAPEIDFGRDVRPIFVARCFACHGPDHEARKAGLRIDERSGVVEGRHPVVVPGDSLASMLLERVSAADPEDRMPPNGEPLSAKEIDILRRWIDAGAEYEGHWAWTPVADIEPPEPESDRSPIDQLIDARIVESKLPVSGAAPPAAQLRRLAFDLTGLPPASADIEAFASDPSEERYRALVEQYLASPQFGEHWGRHWLDLVRYAETRGHEFDYPIPHAWRYRDWVVRALNSDVPYDRFLAEQIAGDLMVEPRLHPEDGTNESLVGTGFWYLGQGVHAPVDVLQDEADRIGNQLEVFSQGMLGLTVACARCHDHKFDPITTRDYYALAGFMQSTREGYAYQDPGQAISAAVNRLRQVSAMPHSPKPADRIAAYLLAATGSPEADVELDPALLERWRTTLADERLRTAGHPLRTAAVLLADGGLEDPKLRDPEIHRIRRGPNTDVVVLDTFDADNGSIADQWVEHGHAFDELASTAHGTLHSGLLDPRLQGTARSRDFALSRRYLHALVRGHKAKLRLVVEGMRMDEYNPLLFEGYIRNIGPEEATPWSHVVIDTHHHPGRDGHIELIDDGPGFLEVDAIWLADTTDAFPSGHIDTPRWLESDFQDRPALARAIDRLANTHGEDTPDGAVLRAALVEEGLYGNTLADADAARATNKAHQVAMLAAARDIPAPRRVLAAHDGFAVDQPVYIRGNPHAPGDTATRSFIDSIAGPQEPLGPSLGSARLVLVDRVLDEGNPFTARVMANRAWHHLTGEGLVRTMDDFGGLGAVPTHPELLDWLATEFRQGEQPWSIKDLVRTIVNTDTYRRASGPVSDRARLVDPGNELLATARVRRLQAEQLRDSMLAISGSLDDAVGGPSVPIHLTEFMTGRGRPGSNGPLDGANRRSLYLSVRRNFADPMLAAFDRPIPTTTVGRRNQSNVPAQALILMNDPFVHEMARRWAERILADDGLEDDTARLQRMAMEAFGRRPEPAELEILRGFADADQKKRSEQWTDLAHALLNAKATNHLE